MIKKEKHLQYIDASTLSETSFPPKKEKYKPSPNFWKKVATSNFPRHSTNKFSFKQPKNHKQTMEKFPTTTNLYPPKWAWPKEIHFTFLVSLQRRKWDLKVHPRGEICQEQLDFDMRLTVGRGGLALAAY